MAPFDWKNLNQDKITSSAEGYDRNFPATDDPTVSRRAKKRLRGMLYNERDEEAGEKKPDNERTEYGIFKGMSGFDKVKK